MAKLRVRDADGAGGEPVRPARKRAPRKPRSAVAKAADEILAQAALAETVPVAVPVSGRFRPLVGDSAGVRLDAVTLRAGRGELPALDSVSFEVAPGELVAVLGPSGAGKTALRNLVAGLERPASGQVWAAGSALDQLGESALHAHRLQRAGLLSGRGVLLDGLTGVENAALPLALAGIGRGDRETRARRLLELFGAGGSADLRPQRMSGLERRLVALARALAGRPGLLLADEPLLGLEEEDGQRVLALLRELQRSGLTVVILTSDPELAAEAGRVIPLRRGRTLQTAAPARATRAPERLEAPARPGAADLVRLALRLTPSAPQAGLFAATAAIASGLAVLAAMLAGVALAAPAVALAAAGFVAGAALAIASVERRRHLLAWLHALGAAPRDLGRLVVLEAGLLGILAGVVGVLVGRLVTPAEHLPGLTLAGAVLVLATSALVAAAAGLAAAAWLRRPGLLRPEL